MGRKKLRLTEIAQLVRELPSRRDHVLVIAVPVRAGTTRGRCCPRDRGRTRALQAATRASASAYRATVNPISIGTWIANTASDSVSTTSEPPLT